MIDPIDGSLNARRTVPLHSLSVAIASGESMADVGLAYVYEFGAGEEFTAVKGEGAILEGRPMEVAEGDGLEVVAMEASKPDARHRRLRGARRARLPDPRARARSRSPSPTSPARASTG